MQQRGLEGGSVTAEVLDPPGRLVTAPDLQAAWRGVGDLLHTPTSLSLYTQALT
jgi:hypothetical protein